MYRFLQINHINRIVNQMGASKTDIGASVFDLSTSYYLVTKNKLHSQEDGELRRRFYRGRSKEKLLPQAYTLSVWRKSMNLRYLIEVALFFGMLIYFQV